MGAMFLLPSYIFMSCWFFKGQWVKKSIFIFFVILFATTGYVTSKTLVSIYHKGTPSLGGNFAFTIYPLCAQKKYTDWSHAQDVLNQLTEKRKKKIREAAIKQGISEDQANQKYLYAEAYKAFKKDPSTLFKNLLNQKIRFLKRLPLHFTRIFNIPLHLFSSRFYWLIVFLLFLQAVQFRLRKGKFPFNMLFFWTCVISGIIASVGFLDVVPFRVLAASWPLIFIFLSLLFSVSVTDQMNSKERKDGTAGIGSRFLKPKLTTILSLACVMLILHLILTPYLAHKLHSAKYNLEGKYITEEVIRKANTLQAVPVVVSAEKINNHGFTFVHDGPAGNSKYSKKGPSITKAFALQDSKDHFQTGNFLKDKVSYPMVIFYLVLPEYVQQQDDLSTKLPNVSMAFAESDFANTVFDKKKTVIAYVTSTVNFYDVRKVVAFEVIDSRGKKQKR